MLIDEDNEKYQIQVHNECNLKRKQKTIKKSNLLMEEWNKLEIYIIIQ